MDPWWKWWVPDEPLQGGKRWLHRWLVVYYATGLGVTAAFSWMMTTGESPPPPWLFPVGGVLLVVFMEVEARQSVNQQWFATEPGRRLSHFWGKASWFVWHMAAFMLLWLVTAAVLLHFHAERWPHIGHIFVALMVASAVVIFGSQEIRTFIRWLRDGARRERQYRSLGSLGAIMFNAALIGVVGLVVLVTTLVILPVFVAAGITAIVMMVLASWFHWWCRQTERLARRIDRYLLTAEYEPDHSERGTFRRVEFFIGFCLANVTAFVVIMWLLDVPLLAMAWLYALFVTVVMVRPVYAGISRTRWWRRQWSGISE
jgi:hypothetical protein